jgi:ABC-type dipeptide/oligopeptide/nickel transport system permease subunit
MAVAEGVAKPAVVSSKSRDRTPLGDALQQLFKNKVAIASAVFIVLLLLSAVAADFINAYNLQGYSEALGPNQPPYAKQIRRDNNALPGSVSQGAGLEGFVYWAGADNLGRDIYTRTIYGTRVSIAVALVAGSVSLTLGIIYGLIAGYMGGRIDDLMMRFVDFLYGLPLLIIVILMQVYFKSLDRQGTENSLVNFILGIDQALGGIFFVFIVLGPDSLD